MNNKNNENKENSENTIPQKANNNASSTVAPFALVELFTSEGCSSCPSADKVAAELVETARQKHTPIFVLCYHVDYWNNLGWRDRFSDKAYSHRQRRYAEVLNLDGVYTPQMIVSGREEFVGSDRARAYRSIQTALQTPSALTLHAEANITEADLATVR
jgi:hypothetical protein